MQNIDQSSLNIVLKPILSLKDNIPDIFRGSKFQKSF